MVRIILTLRSIERSSAPSWRINMFQVSPAGARQASRSIASFSSSHSSPPRTPPPPPRFLLNQAQQFLVAGFPPRLVPEGILHILVYLFLVVLLPDIPALPEESRAGGRIDGASTPTRPGSSF